MHTIPYKTGLWASVLLALSFVAWIVCFTGIALTSPLFIWTNLTDYLLYEQSYSQVFQLTAKFFMLVFAPLYVLMIYGYYHFAAADKRDLVRISLLFALAFAILSSINYFVQLTVVRLNVEAGSVEGLEHFVQANPLSVMTAIAMLGWTLFLGLSSFFIYPVFKGQGVIRVLRYTFLFNGISCMLAGIGYALKIDMLTFFFANIGTGGAILVASICSLILFRRELKK